MAAATLETIGIAVDLVRTRTTRGFSSLSPRFLPLHLHQFLGFLQGYRDEQRGDTKLGSICLKTTSMYKGSLTDFNVADLP